MGLRRTSFGNIRSSNLGIRATNWGFNNAAATISFLFISKINIQMNNNADLSVTVTLDVSYSYSDVFNARYASLYEMMRHFGSTELTQCSDRTQRNASPEMLDAIARNTDMTIFGNDPVTIAATFEVAKVIQHYAKAVDDFVDSYLLDYHIELIPEKYDPPYLLRDVACNILRWHLYSDGKFEDKFVIQRRYEDAIRKLEMIRNQLLTINIPRRTSGIGFDAGRKHWGF